MSLHPLSSNISESAAKNFIAIDHESPLNIASILQRIFTLCIHEMRLVATFSQVCKLWHQVIIRSDLWEKICQQAGIALPFDVSRSYEACRYEYTPFFLQQVKENQTPTVNEFHIAHSYSQYEAQFAQDRYLILKSEHDISVVDLESDETINRLNVKETIHSVCTSQYKLYLGLSNHKVALYSLNERCEKISTLKHSTDTNCGNIKLLANDRWLVSYAQGETTLTVKQWNTLTGQCVASIVKPSDFNLVQISQNELYATSLVRSAGYQLLSCHLEQCSLAFSICEGLENHYFSDRETLKIHNKVAYHIRDVLFEYPPASNLAHWHFEAINLVSRESMQYKIRGGPLMDFQSVNGMSIIALKDWDNNQSTKALGFPLLKVQFIDIASNTSIGRMSKRLNNPQTMDSYSPITIFNGSMLFTIQDRVYRVSFKDKK